MSDERDGFTLVDHGRNVYLGDVGLPDYFAATCVTSSGGEELWLVNAAVLGVENADHGCGDQPHEQLGPLPDRWRTRTLLAPYRCGRPRADGRPCRQYVGAAGSACGWHAERAEAP